MAIQAKNRVTFKRLIDGRTLNFTLDTNISSTQVMTKDPVAFSPNYPTTNLVITPYLFVSGGGGTNKVGGTCRWFDGGAAIANNADYAIGTTAPYGLTVKGNLTVPSKVIRCEYDYTDEVSGLKTTVTASITLQRVENAGTMIMAVIDAPTKMFKTVEGKVQNLVFTGRMLRGADEDTTNVAFSWEIQTGNGTFVNAAGFSGCTVSGAEGSVTGKTLTVPSSAVVNVATIRLTAKDTDSSSSTYNHSVKAIESIVDFTDPYELVIDTPMGDSMPDSATTGRPLVLGVMQGSKMVSTAFYDGKKLSFYRLTAAGERDQSSWATAADFSGWTIGTGTTDKMVISRQYSAGNGTESNRTVSILPKHLSGQTTTFEATLE